MGEASHSNRNPALRALVPLFLVSGGTSLVYETVWARQLHLVFGTSQLAICTVLAAFMLGLALGAWLAGRLARRARRPLLVYGLLEAFIGVYALAFPSLVSAVEPIYLGFARAFEPGPQLFGVFQLLILGLLLLPPTVCMGATLPLLCRFATVGTEQPGRQVGRLYGANTLGAVLGTGIAGFVLLPQVGLAATTMSAVVANWILAAVAIGLALRCGVVDTDDARDREVASKSQSPSAIPRALLVVAVLAGFSSLLYEVAWFRLMVLVLGGSAYAFSIMLLAFLLGIGLGGWFGGAAADRAFRAGGARRVIVHLAYMQMGVGLLSYVAMFVYPELPFAFLWLFRHFQQAPMIFWCGKLVLAVLIMLPPALLMGAAFPFLVRAAGRSITGIARPVGQFYALNTIGAVLGAFAGGVLLLPVLHVRGSILAAVSCNLIAAFVVITATRNPAEPSERIRIARWAAACALGLAVIQIAPPPWNPLVMNSGAYKYASRLPEATREHLLATIDSAELLYYEEGPSSVVTVRRNRITNNISLVHNGKVDASSIGDRETQIMLAQAPFLCRPQAERVLVIGLASGITAGSVTLHDAPRTIDIVEIEPAVLAASRFFDHVNHRPLDDPRVRVRINDARNHLQLSSDGAYDMVISEPSNPWLSGAANLFTHEFFELGKRKMSPGGVWTQWLQLYGMQVDDLRSVLATFESVYQHVNVFLVDNVDLILLGSDEPLEMTAANAAEIFNRPGLRDDLGQVGVRSASDFLARFLFDENGIRQLATRVGLNTDDNMRIEYSAPLHLHDSTKMANLLLLFSATEVPFSAFETVRGVAALAESYIELDQRDRALATLRTLEFSAPGDPVVEALRESMTEQLTASGESMESD